MTKENQRNIDAAGREVQEAFLKFLRVCAANIDNPIHVYSMVIVLVNKMTSLVLSVMSEIANRVNKEAEGKEGDGK